jgi:hypothetical protein
MPRETGDVGCIRPKAVMRRFVLKWRNILRYCAQRPARSWPPKPNGREEVDDAYEEGGGLNGLDTNLRKAPAGTARTHVLTLARWATVLRSAQQLSGCS